MALPSGKSVVCPVLIGRVSDLHSLHSLIDQARSGAGGTILISGEAGIGKSRMVAEVKTYAAAQGFLLLQGSCFPTDSSCPYAPLLDLLRTLHVSSPPASLLASLETLARDIFPLLPELVSERTFQPSGLEPEQEKRRLFAVLSNFFIQLSLDSPVLFVIEDAHWSDSTSLDFLHYLTRRLTSHPILLLVTYRQEETFPLLNGWLAQLDRERFAHEIKLLRLSRSDVDTMLSAIFDERHEEVYEIQRLPSREKAHRPCSGYRAKRAGHRASSMNRKDYLMNVTDILKYGQLTVMQTIEGFPETDWETPGACGYWSVKDILAHLASYERVLIDILASSGAGGSTPALDAFIEQGAQFNDGEVDRRKDNSIRDVLAEFNDTHAQVMSLVAGIAPEKLREVGTLPWYGVAYSLDDVLVYMYYGHKREHSAQIAAFKDILKQR